MLYRNSDARGVVPPHLIVLTGQSNAVGATAASDLPGYLDPGTPDAGIKIWTSGGSFATLHNGVNGTTLDYPTAGFPATDQWGLEAELAYRLRQATPSATVFIVKHAYGGIPLSSAIGDGNGGSGNWDPASVSNYFSQTTAYVAAAKAAIGGPCRVTNIFVGMEQDAAFQVSADAAATNLPAYIAAARTDWGAERFIIGKTKTGTFSSTVRAAQDGVASASVKLIDTSGYSTSDGVHYTAASLVAMGLTAYGLMV